MISPLTSPKATAATGPLKGISEILVAIEAPIIAAS